MKRKEKFALFWSGLFLSAAVFQFPQTGTQDLTITDIQPVQVLLDNYRIIKGKPVAFRLTVQSTFGKRVYAKIGVQYNFGGSTYIETGPESDGVPLTPGENIVYVPGGPSLPFSDWAWVWPRPPFSLIWDDVGSDDEVAAVIDPLDEIDEFKESNNSITAAPMEVVDAQDIRVLWIPVAFPDEEDWSVNDSVMAVEKRYMLSIYPLAEENLIFEEGACWRCPDEPVYGTYAIDRDWMYEHVVQPVSVLAQISGYDRVVICVNKEFGALGRAAGVLREPRDKTPIVCKSHFSTFALGIPEIQVSLVAHELGHTFDLWHPHDLGPPVFTSVRYSLLAGDYGDANPTFMSYRDEPAWIDVGRYKNDPRIYFPPGEYHFPGDPWAGIDSADQIVPVSFWQWNLFEQLTAPYYRTQVVVINGLRDLQGTIFMAEPWYQVYAHADVSNINIDASQFAAAAADVADYQVRLAGDNDATIALYPLKISHDYADHDDYQGGIQQHFAERIPFRLNLPFVSGTRKIQIIGPDSFVAAERIVSSNAPTVEVTSPNGGEAIGIGEVFPISWQGFDIDGDSLTYSVFYSKDDGASWIPLAAGLAQLQFDWDTTWLNPGTGYRVKVMACDGVNTGSDISDGGFTVGGNTIFVDIKPGSCPNPLNVESRGLLSVAVCGTNEFDVATLDPGSILLRRDGYGGGVAPVSWAYEDAATPFTGGTGELCHDRKGDGLMDLVLKFKIQDVVETLQLLYSPEETVPLLIFGTAIRASEEIVVMGMDYVLVLRDQK